MEDMRKRRYQIIVSGRLGRVSREVFRDLQINPHGTDTALTGDLNPTGLYDVLTRMQDLALALVGLTCLTPEPDTGHQTDAVNGGEHGTARQARDLLLPEPVTSALS